MVQYHLDGPKVEIKVKPHGNSKSVAPFFRTSNTTRKRITTVASTYNPKQAFNIITLEQGGELEVKGAGCVPRNRRQISYARRKTTKRCQSSLQCNVRVYIATGKSAGFVKDVKAAPQPMCVLSFDWHLMIWSGFLLIIIHLV